MRVVVGVDSGGSTTRALAATLQGERVAYAETGGGNFQHDGAADQNVAEAIRRVAGGHEVVRIVAGVAGLNGPGDEARIAAAIPEFGCARSLVNDAAVAHFAAFGEEPGIVSIQGTGSTVRAVLEDGRVVKNGDFFHYARGGAVWVGIRAVQDLLKDSTAAHEGSLREVAFELWGVETIESLRDAVSRQMDLSSFERSRRYGTIARTVTRSAENGGPFSRALCADAAREIVDGILLLGPMFASEGVPVAFVGACVQSSAMLEAVTDLLARSRGKRYRIVEAETSPVIGAVRMALREEGVDLRGEALQRLVRSKP